MLLTISAIIAMIYVAIAPHGGKMKSIQPLIDAIAAIALGLASISSFIFVASFFGILIWRWVWWIIEMASSMAMAL